jgi:hypothetical protein
MVFAKTARHLDSCVESYKGMELIAKRSRGRLLWCATTLFPLVLNEQLFGARDGIDGRVGGEVNASATNNESRVHLT